MAEPLDEFGLITALFAPLTNGYTGAYNLTDDAAFIAAEPGKILTVTTDSLVEGVHFYPLTEPALVARKALRVNLSDLAAKGARPFAVLLNVAFPPTIDGDWVTRFAQGLKTDLDLFDCALIGGDTVSTPGPLMVSVTAFGWADPAHAPHRSSAQEGDLIWVSGTIGDGGLGLHSDDAFLKNRYQLPEPRVRLGIAIAPLIHASMDVSDGLVQDLGHICRASGLRAEIEVEHIPLSKAYQASGHDVLKAMVMGDDYELLFTAAADQTALLNHQAAEVGVDITCIGRMIKGEGVVCQDSLGRDVTPLIQGWQHFKGEGHRS